MQSTKPLSQIKSSIMLFCVLGYGIFIIVFPFIFPSSWFNPMLTMSGFVLNVFIFLTLFILALYFKFIERGVNTKELSLIAIYSAFTAIARIPFAAFPSIQPCSYLIFCAGYVFGPLIGFIIGGNTAIISNIILGHGPWTVFQIVGWGLIGITGGIYPHSAKQLPNKYLIAIVGFIWGFLFGWIGNLWSWLLLPKQNLESFIFVNLNSLVFDLSHAIANVVFLFYFGQKTINILKRYRIRFTFVMVPPLPT
jgi:energy-coupling factor transport system substrate-specific component